MDAVQMDDQEKSRRYLTMRYISTMVDFKKALAVINPGAGGGSAMAKSAPLLAQLQSHYDLDRMVSKRVGDISESLLDRVKETSYDAIFSFGGDGTMFEILQGIMPWRSDYGVMPTLGWVPVGTGNSFLRDFKIKDSASAVNMILQHHTKKIDVIRLTHEEGELFFVNMLSMGFAARVGKLTNEQLKPFGMGGYLLAVLLCAAQLRTYPLSYGGKLHQTTLVSFCNSQYTGGEMWMAPDALMDDGKLDCINIGPISRLRLLTALPKIFSGAHVSLPEVKISQHENIEFDVKEPVDCVMDGEVIRLVPKRLDVLPKFVSIFTP